MAAQATRIRGRGEGDDWLRVAGFFGEVEAEAGDARLRARCAPQTGWAGFLYDADTIAARCRCAIGREEALRCASTHGAWLSFDEDKRGTLERGKLADLIVLKDDPMTVPAERLAALAREKTVVGGKTVWAAAR